MELKAYVPHKPGLTKTLRIVKLTAIILLSFCLQVSAKTWGQTITLNVKDQPIEKVFAEIKRQTGYTFTYRQELVDQVKTVSVNVKNATINETLDQCFIGKPFTYKIVDKIISIDINPPKYDSPMQIINSALIDIHGKVVNEKGEPVEGVTVTVKGTSTGTSTNGNGDFYIKTIDEKATLIFTSINMERFELRVNSKSDLVINLKTKITALGNVAVTVNTGYQQISRERMVGSFSQLDSASFHRRDGSLGIIDRLDGNVTGMLFDYKTGRSDLDRVQIRGISSLGGPGSNQYSLLTPLIVLDNFPYSGDLNSINPNDIENITVLKDAAAASIWGARAGNGVIVVTTKKARYSQSLSINVSSNVTVQEKPDLYYYPQMSSSDFINVELFLFNKGFYNSQLTNISHPIVSPVVEILNKRRNVLISAGDSASQIDALRGLDFRNDLNKYVYQPGITQQHYLNVKGGSAQFNYQLSTGYNQTRPNIQGSKPDEQFTLSSNIAFRPIRNLEIQTGINYSRDNNKTTGFELPYPSVYPYAQLADVSGKSMAMPNSVSLSYADTSNVGKLLDWHYRPLDEIRNSDNSTLSQFVKLNFGLNYRFFSWLNTEVKYQYIDQSSAQRNYYSQQTFYTRNLINTYTNLSQNTPSLKYPVPLGGILDLINNDSYSNNIRGQLNFNKSWGNQKHIVSAIIAGELSENNGASYANRFYGYNDVIGTYNSNVDYVNLYPEYSRRSANIPQQDSYREGPLNHFVSILANANYTYENKYSVYGSLRRDGANVFGVSTNNKWKPLWSSGLGWDISKENFFKIEWVSMMRLRGSYGYSGNVDNGLSGLSTIVYGTLPAFLTNLQSAQVNNPPNPNLRWEEVKTANIGIDWSLLKGRLNGSLDIFNKKSIDLISQVTFAPSTGINLFTVNSASLKGNGFEVVINSKNLVGKFQWETNFSLGHARSIVTQVYNRGFTASDYIGYGLNPGVGQLAYSVGAYKWAGLDPNTGDPQGFLGKQVSKNYVAILSDSIQNQKIVGSAIPLYSGFIRNSFSWKGFTLSANITYRLDFYFRKPVLSYFALFNQWQGNAEYVNRWQKPGDEIHTNVPSLIYPDNSNRDQFYQYSEINVLRGDNIKLQDVRLQYDLNRKIWNKLPLQQAQVFVYANNLNIILWRKQKSTWDPDFTGGVSGYIIPVPHTWTVGLNISF